MRANARRFSVKDADQSGLAHVTQRHRRNVARRPLRHAIHAALLCMMAGSLFVAAVTAAAQTRTFTREGVRFTLELPSPKWRAVSRLDVHDHVEFINGNNPLDGYLGMRENCVDAGTTAADLARRERQYRLRHLPGYIDCSEESFTGNYKGAKLSYEYTSGGRLMAGRIYFLQIDNRTIYTLHFTAQRGAFRRAEDEVNSVVQSFRLRER